MLCGIGFDVVETARFKRALEHRGERFLKRLFTESEIHYCEKKRHKERHYAARFAAKEAALKALGLGWPQGIKWTDLEVVSPPGGGRPQLHLRGRAKEKALVLGSKKVFLSISHAPSYAVSQVILTD